MVTTASIIHYHPLCSFAYFVLLFPFFVFLWRCKTYHRVMIHNHLTSQWLFMCQVHEWDGWTVPYCPPAFTAKFVLQWRGRPIYAVFSWCLTYFQLNKLTAVYGSYNPFHSIPYWCVTWLSFLFNHPWLKCWLYMLEEHDFTIGIIDNSYVSEKHWPKAKSNFRLMEKILYTPPYISSKQIVHHKNDLLLDVCSLHTLRHSRNSMLPDCIFDDRL